MAKKAKISRQDAQQLASDFILREQSSATDWRFEIVSVEPDQIRLGDWSVVVDRITSPDVVIDGPEVLIVNGETGEVKTLASFYQ